MKTKNENKYDIKGSLTIARKNGSSLKVKTAESGGVEYVKESAKGGTAIIRSFLFRKSGGVFSKSSKVLASKVLEVLEKTNLSEVKDLPRDYKNFKILSLLKKEIKNGEVVRYEYLKK